MSAARCPPRLRDMIESCLAKDAGQRPSPADLLTWYRAQTAGQTLPAWLPAEVAADVAQYSPPAPAGIGGPRPAAVLSSYVPGPAAAPPGGRARVWMQVTRRKERH